jgi:hypothetical protein
MTEEGEKNQIIANEDYSISECRAETPKLKIINIIIGMAQLFHQIRSACTRHRSCGPEYSQKILEIKIMKSNRNINIEVIYKLNTIGSEKKIEI